MCCGEYIIGIDLVSCSRNHLQQLMSELAAVAIAVRKEQHAHEWLRPTGVWFTCVATYKACVMSDERAQSVDFGVLKIAPHKWRGTRKPMTADVFNHLLADTRCKDVNYLHLLDFNVSGHFYAEIHAVACHFWNLVKNSPPLHTDTIPAVSVDFESPFSSVNSTLFSLVILYLWNYKNRPIVDFSSSLMQKLLVITQNSGLLTGFLPIWQQWVQPELFEFPSISTTCTALVFSTVLAEWMSRANIFFLVFKLLLTFCHDKWPYATMKSD